jgi:hypothetical protein
MLDITTLKKTQDWLKVRAAKAQTLEVTHAIEGLYAEITNKIRDVELAQKLEVKKTDKYEETICPTCGHSKKRYKISFSGVQVRLAKILFQYCVDNKTYIVETGEIAKRMSHTDYGNFASLQRFGLMYYLKDENRKKQRGQFGVPLKRLHKFLKNEWDVAEYFWRDEDEGTNQHSETRIFLHQVKRAGKILDPETMLPYFLEFETNPHFEYTS